MFEAEMFDDFDTQIQCEEVYHDHLERDCDEAYEPESVLEFDDDIPF